MTFEVARKRCDDRLADGLAHGRLANTEVELRTFLDGFAFQVCKSFQKTLYIRYVTGIVVGPARPQVNKCEGRECLCRYRSLKSQNGH